MQKTQKRVATVESAARSVVDQFIDTRSPGEILDESFVRQKRELREAVDDYYQRWKERRDMLSRYNIRALTLLSGVLITLLADDQGLPSLLKLSSENVRHSPAALVRRLASRPAPERNEESYVFALKTTDALGYYGEERVAWKMRHLADNAVEIIGIDWDEVESQLSAPFMRIGASPVHAVSTEALIGASQRHEDLDALMADLLAPPAGEGFAYARGTQEYFWNAGGLEVAQGTTLALAFESREAAERMRSELFKQESDGSEMPGLPLLVETDHGHVRYAVNDLLHAMQHSHQPLDLDKLDGALLYYRTALFFWDRDAPSQDQNVIDYLKESAERGYARAQYYLAGLYARGEGVEKSDEEAARWYREAAERGFLFNELPLEELFSMTDRAARQAEAPGDTLLAVQTAFHADPTDATNLHNYAWLLLKQGCHSEAARYLRQVVALQPDHLEAQFNLGSAYFNEAIDVNERLRELDRQHSNEGGHLSEEVLQKIVARARELTGRRTELFRQATEPFEAVREGLLREDSRPRVRRWWSALRERVGQRDSRPTADLQQVCRGLSASYMHTGQEAKARSIEGCEEPAR